MTNSRISELRNELVFKATPSQGPGGQNVNRVNSRIELRLNIRDSRVLREDEKSRLELYCRSRITSEGDLLIVAQESRSQLQNKKLAISRLFTIIEKALAPTKNRKPTRPTRASVRKRLDGKRKKSEKKKLRTKRNLNRE